MEGYQISLDAEDRRFDVFDDDDEQYVGALDGSAHDDEEGVARAVDWNDAQAAGVAPYASYAKNESQNTGRHATKGRIRHLRGQPPLATRIGVVVVACAVIVGLVGAAVYRLHADTPPATAKISPVAPHSPPVITLLSPSGTAAPSAGGSGAVAPLPATNAPAPSQYLAPDKPSAYEMSLIAASGSPEKAIVVSRDSQTIHVYQNGQFIAGSYAITGRPQLPTPVGVYQIFFKEAPAVLYSPWPPSSPYYYTPEPVNYVMEFRAGGFLIHDAPWHHVWGPGMNDWHYDPIAKEWQWGTHGCVSAPTPFIQWLYNWSPYGTTVIVY